MLMLMQKSPNDADDDYYYCYDYDYNNGDYYYRCCWIKKNEDDAGDCGGTGITAADGDERCYCSSLYFHWWLHWKHGWGHHVADVPPDDNDDGDGDSCYCCSLQGLSRTLLASRSPNLDENIKR